MPEPRVNGLVRIVLNWQTVFGPAVNVMHVEDPGVGTTLTGIAQLFETAYSDFILSTATGASAPVANYLHTGCDLLSIDAIDWSQIDGAAGSVTPDPAIDGAGSQPEPGQISIVISWKTGFSGRSKRGRTYLPGISTTAATSGRINGTARDNIRLAANELIQDLDTAGIPLVIYSRKEPGSFTPVTSAVVDDRFDTQRSRAD